MGGEADEGRGAGCGEVVGAGGLTVDHDGADV
jgi:hypothetical protein